ncbi:MAG: glycosyltransferase family A protein, partial [Planctomycetota bacterium]
MIDARGTPPRFTVITPTYNRGFIVGRAIESVLKQTYKNWEMIIVDDGSTDDTREQINAKLSDPRIRAYFEPVNHGVHYARNRGLDRISTETDWIVELDSDDVLLPDALENIERVIRQNTGFEWYEFGVRWD